MKKIITILMIMLLLTGCGSSDPKKEVQTALKNDISLTWLTSNVKNDTTGNWRVSECLTSKQPQEYAKQYYDAYFESDDEVHAVINFTLNTTNRFTVQSDCLYVDTFDYVQGEEHDANSLFTGSLLHSYKLNKEPGDVISEW